MANNKARTSQSSNSRVAALETNQKERNHEPVEVENQGEDEKVSDREGSKAERARKRKYDELISTWSYEVGGIIGALFKSIGILTGVYEASDRDHRRHRRDNFEYYEFDNRIAALEEGVSSVDQIVDNEKIISGVSNVLKDDVERSLIKHINEKYSKQFINSETTENINEIFLESIERLSKARQSIALRSFINLLVGVSIAVSGGYLMYDFVDEFHEIYNGKEIGFVAIASLSRLSLVVLIQIFAYFFLNLYRLGLQEIKYYENELTNTLNRMAGIYGAFNSGEKILTSHVVKALMSTERNFILKKGESTVELSQNKQEREADNELAETITSSIKSYLQRSKAAEKRAVGKK